MNPNDQGGSPPQPPLAPSAHTLQESPPTDPKYDGIQSFPTPAHPLPKKLPKLLVVLILGIILFGISVSVFAMISNEKNQKEAKTASDASNTHSDPTVALFPTTSIDELVSKNTPNASWKTYETWNFTVQYPEDAMTLTKKAQRFNKTSDGDEVSIAPPRGENDNDWYSVSILVEQNTENLTTEAVAKKMIDDLKKDSLRTNDELAQKLQESKRPYTNNDINGIYMLSGIDYDLPIVVLATKNNIYSFTVIGPEGNASIKTQNVFNKILSTFKFTGEMSITKPAQTN